MSEVTRRGFVKGMAIAAPLAFTPFTMAQTSAAPRYDFVIAGAGHNSLMTACYLQLAGFKCIVLEGRPTVGGGVKTAQLTLRGFHHDVCSSAHGLIRQNPAIKNNELNLGEYGLEYIFPDPLYHYPFADGSYITKWRDFDRTCDEIAKYSRKDAETYRRLGKELQAFKAATGISGDVESAGGMPPFMPPGWGKSDSKAIAEHPEFRRWKRRMSLSKWDALHQHYEDERTMVMMMAPWPTSTPSYPCTAPGQGLAAYPPIYREEALPKGGSGMLSVALQRHLEGHGGEVIVNKPVERLIIEGGKCVGVECADGSSFHAAKAVISTIHIKRLVDLAPKDLWGDEFLEGVENFKTGDAAFNSHYATSIPVMYPVKGGTIAPVHSATLRSPSHALRFETELANGIFTWDDPVLHVVQTSVADPSRVPKEGMQTLRILCEQGVYDRKNGENKHLTPLERWEEIKDEVADAHLKCLQKLAPSLTDDKILARTVITPPQCEQMNPSMWHGSCHGGVDTPAQSGANRPVPGWGQYKMPIPGLYQVGSTTHPGGGVTGGSGRAGAMVLLKEFGNTSIEEVLAKQKSKT